MNFCLAALFAAGILTGSAGCGLMERPSAQIAGAKLQDVGLTEATMLFDVKVDNPYTVPLPMSNVDYALASQGQRFLTGKADVQGEVPAKGSKVLGVPVHISYMELINAVKGARPGGTIPYTADLGLSVDVPALGPLRLPMSKEGQLTIPSAQSLLEQLKGLAK
ncbi:MAG TPA: LEA type 2 family protein [Phycisphaerae bacterium]|nr:LEA type 2 family protein [Phycisphaerae bacterium]